MAETTLPPADAAPPSGGAGFLRSLARVLAPLAALVLMVLYFTVRSQGRYLAPDNVWDILDQAAIIVIVGVGQTLVIIAGGIDLSVGAVMAFTGTLAAVMMLQWNVAAPIAAISGVLAGSVIGFFNGFVSVKTRIHPFIVTLGSMMIFRGLGLALTDARNTSLLPASFTVLSTGVFPLGPNQELVIPHILVLYLVLIAAVAHVLLAYTRLGRFCFAIGSNPESVRLSGISVDRWMTIYFVIAGALFGFAGVLQAARIKIGSPNGSQNAELEAIAAAVIGGTSLSGGQGTIIGTVLGALLMAALRIGLRMEQLQPHWQMFWLGVAIIVAVIYDRASRRRMK